MSFNQESNRIPPTTPSSSPSRFTKDRISISHTINPIPSPELVSYLTKSVLSTRKIPETSLTSKEISFAPAFFTTILKSSTSPPKTHSSNPKTNKKRLFSSLVDATPPKPQAHMSSKASSTFSTSSSWSTP